jgi:hypothetical protein
MKADELGVGAAELFRRPPHDGVVDHWVQTEKDRLPPSEDGCARFGCSDH